MHQVLLYLLASLTATYYVLDSVLVTSITFKVYYGAFCLLTAGMVLYLINGIA